ncbi:MAG: hypothetical protein COU07_00760 [Candidatus Harrisonbacteria bacterium CG10_big_fil_rev_8_21_14_0_10_40_38]|uniref:DoxX family protein n=1 Tax=Candidatus Harrisonbacteria bacterium CG10_big_fil_rev_8_21_14_0_10_40_38 TaxID=1974583 RepID=A0A2H0UUU2_9BACT|nr:MAG: hypothetical protein COU07_00760 [Candidatus Harrisonbacteria bacterium CG10_big_fil_rev_8_21_14_0_10_40_38]
MTSLWHVKVGILLLKIGIASVFFYAGIASFLDPLSWVGYFPHWLRDLFPEALLSTGFSIFEIALALWVLSTWKTKYAALVSTFTLVGIIIANMNLIDILFRDLAILFSSLALFMLSPTQKTISHEHAGEKVSEA